ncbi:MAG TPA: DUF1697 domain-containing protein [Candidatus Dormibacteraeota bacterium]|nr:DUF1697 domain-containing protein [Candidatus Dormibacteraeota bacterium]
MSHVPRHVVLLRGINLVKRNRIAMPELRAALEAAGFRDVSTYVQSGNVLLSSTKQPERVARDVNVLIKERFGLDIAVVVRSREELAQIVRHNPLRKVVNDPKRHLVTFMSAAPPAEWVQLMRDEAGPQEQLTVKGREVYSWHPAGVGRSPLWERLAGKLPDITATTRNWSTVTTLAAMADGTTDR